MIINLGPQDCRRRQLHSAMASTPLSDDIASAPWCKKRMKLRIYKQQAFWDKFL